MANLSRLPGRNADFWDWQLRALCRGMDCDTFFHPDHERGEARQRREETAKSICGSCPVRTECLEHALAVREPYGVWGGLTEHERAELLKQQRTGLAG